MIDIKSILSELKENSSPELIQSYKEAVNQLLETPASYLSNLEYIISSRIGLESFQTFIQRYPIPVSQYNNIFESLEVYEQKASFKNINPNPYTPLVESLSQKIEELKFSIMISERYSEMNNNNYVSTYYEALSSSNFGALYGRYGKFALPDMMYIESTNKNGKCNILESVIMSNDSELNESVYHVLIDEVILYSYRENNGVEKMIGLSDQIFENSLSGQFADLNNREQKAIQESVLSMGTSLDDVDIKGYEYTESELTLLESLISFKTDVLSCDYSIYNELMELSEKAVFIEDYLEEKLSDLFKKKKKDESDNSDKNDKPVNHYKVEKKKISDLSTELKDPILKFQTELYNKILSKEKDVSTNKYHQSFKTYIKDGVGYIYIPTGDKAQPNVSMDLLCVTSVDHADGDKAGEEYVSLIAKLLKEVKSEMKDIPAGYTFNILNDDYNNILILKASAEKSKTIAEYFKIDNVITESVFTELNTKNYTSNKKTGKIPDYMRLNHNMGYGEDDTGSKTSSDYSGEFDAEENDKDDLQGTGTPKNKDLPKLEDVPKEIKDEAKTNPGIVYNYNYYNSFNKSNSENISASKDSSSHNTNIKNVDDHSNHSTNTNIKNVNTKDDTKTESPEVYDEKAEITKNKHGTFYHGNLADLPTNIESLVKKAYLKSRELITEIIKKDDRYKSIRDDNTIYKLLKTINSEGYFGNFLVNSKRLTFGGNNILLTTINEMDIIESVINDTNIFTNIATNMLPSIVKSLNSSLPAGYKCNVWKHSMRAPKGSRTVFIIISIDKKVCEEIISHVDKENSIKQESLRQEKTDQFINEMFSVDIFEEAKSPEDGVINQIYNNLISLKKETESILKPGLKEYIKKENKSKNFGEFKYQYPAVGIKFGDTTGPFVLGTLGLKGKIKKHLNELINYPTGSSLKIIMFITLEIISTTHKSETKTFGFYKKAIKDLLKPLVKDDKIGFDYREEVYVYVSTTYTNFPVFVNKEYLLKNVDTEQLESVITEAKKETEAEKQSRTNTADPLNPGMNDNQSSNKPKSDHPVRDKLMDIDRATTKGQQAAKKGVQNVVNVGKAAVKPFKRTAQWMTNLVNEWKDKDETKIKEKLADPRQRSALFEGIKKAIAIGSLHKAGLLFNPIFLFLAITKRAGQGKKEFRLRNEMIGELKTELNIIDEKIADADRKGDTANKYKLMRLKNELQKKLLRVGGGKDIAKIL